MWTLSPWLHLLSCTIPSQEHSDCLKPFIEACNMQEQHGLGRHYQPKTEEGRNSGGSGGLFRVADGFLNHLLAPSKLTEYTGWRSHSQQTKKLLLEALFKYSLSIKALKDQQIHYIRYPLAEILISLWERMLMLAGCTKKILTLKPTSSKVVWCGGFCLFYCCGFFFLISTYFSDGLRVP